MSELATILEQLTHTVPSEISHHGQRCCDVAVAWYRSLARAQGSTESGLAWMRDRWPWGPQLWPIHWCEIVTAPRVDCGGHAALGRALCAARGVPAVPVQLIEQYDPSTAAGWRALWTSSGAAVGWIWDSHVYHEAIAMLDGDELRAWDTSDARTIATPHDGYSGIAAIRFCDGGGPAARWAGRQVVFGEWLRED